MTMTTTTIPNRVYAIKLKKHVELRACEGTLSRRVGVVYKVEKGSKKVLMREVFFVGGETLGFMPLYDFTRKARLSYSHFWDKDVYELPEKLAQRVLDPKTRKRFLGV